VVTFLRLSDEVVESFPEAMIRIVVTHGLRNADHWEETTRQLEDTELAAREGRVELPGESHPAIASWHEAYRKFGTNPRRIRSSVDALHRRLARQGRLPRVNGAVDAYNLTAVRFVVPAGAFDSQALTGAITIRFAEVGDRFTPLGKPDVVEEPPPGEVVYVYGHEVLTRHWNHRDAHHTRVQEHTASAIFLLERVTDDVGSDQLLAAQTFLAGLLMPHATKVSCTGVDASMRSVELAIASDSGHLP
jgi:DNA/RNA-binding domain of Phe-tRNA-synthetase-like protein